MDDERTIWQKILEPYQPQLDEINNDQILKRYLRSKDEPIEALILYAHLVEIMENGPHNGFTEETLKRGKLEKKDIDGLVLLAEKLRPFIDGKPTIAKIVRFELERSSPL